MKYCKRKILAGAARLRPATKPEIASDRRRKDVNHHPERFKEQKRHHHQESLNLLNPNQATAD
jgi:hypothetical protein